MNDWCLYHQVCRSEEGCYDRHLNVSHFREADTPAAGVGTGEIRGPGEVPRPAEYKVQLNRM